MKPYPDNPSGTRGGKNIKYTASQSRLAFFAAAFIGFSLPLFAHAFSLGDLWREASQTIQPVARASEGVLIHQVSETPALRAAINTDPNPVKGTFALALSNNIALVPVSGPEGGLADLVDVGPKDPTQISIYVVRKDDTLSEIAKMYDVTPNTILWANDLDSARQIKPGQTLVILPVSGIQHIVKKGETLAAIVKKYKGEMEDVLDYNNLASESAIKVGETILIPYGVEPAVVSVSAGVSTQYSGPSLIGYFLRPLVGGTKTRGIHGHNGVDLGARTGTNVLASASGTIIVSRSSGYNGGYGQYVVIVHPNGTQTLYGHLSQNYVQAGTFVNQGDIIGAVGSTGRSTGPHLHFEVRGASNPF
ncbi:MAG: LysM peptidoglycan-binding domain-containing M23 family metallopeptidase [Patescibacteria group bacterium]